jgi:transposase
MQEVSMVQRRDRRQRHTPEFKCQAVQLMHERIAAGATLQRVSDELDVSPDLLRVWSKQVAAAPAHATAGEIFPGHGKRRLTHGKPRGLPGTPSRSAEQELARLQRELERVRQERDFLKKAAAFFAKESR